MSNGLYVERAKNSRGYNIGYNMYKEVGGQRDFYAFVPDAALNWNPGNPIIERLKEYLKENPIE